MIVITLANHLKVLQQELLLLPLQDRRVLLHGVQLNERVLVQSNEAHVEPLLLLEVIGYLVLAMLRLLLIVFPESDLNSI